MPAPGRAPRPAAAPPATRPTSRSAVYASSRMCLLSSCREIHTVVCLQDVPGAGGGGHCPPPPGLPGALRHAIYTEVAVERLPLGQREPAAGGGLVPAAPGGARLGARDGARVEGVGR